MMKDWLKERMDFSKEYRGNLIDKVIEQIQDDLEMGDATALAELLGFVPTDKLEGFLREE
jgi:hypothetical protein